MHQTSILKLETSFFILITFISFGHGVRIVQLQVPEITKHGSSVVLDCDYELEGKADDTDLVVKWFFDDSLVYQWIPDHSKEPQSDGVLKDKLNLDYRASNNSNTMHRALHILSANAALSGKYTCVVSTLLNEDKKTKKMIVFVPEKSLQLRQEVTADGSLRVVCTAEKVHPRPHLYLSMGSIALEGKELLNQKDGLFDITTTSVLRDAQIQSPIEFTCELKVPQANYTVRRQSIFYNGADTASTNSSLLCFLSLFITVCISCGSFL